MFLGEVTPSLLVSSKSIGDLALSRLLEGLLSSNLLILLLRIDLCVGDRGDLLEATEAPAAAAALIRCWRRPGLRPNRWPVKGASRLGFGGWKKTVHIGILTSGNTIDVKKKTSCSTTYGIGDLLFSKNLKD